MSEQLERCQACTGLQRADCQFLRDAALAGISRIVSQTKEIMPSAMPASMAEQSHEIALQTINTITAEAAAALGRGGCQLSAETIRTQLITEAQAE